jgi:hypothetical protein
VSTLTVWLVCMLQAKVTAHELRALMNKKQNIRNMSIYAHVDHGTRRSHNLYMCDVCASSVNRFLVLRTGKVTCPNIQISE